MILGFFTYPATIIALQMKKCRTVRHNLTNICSQTLLSFCGVFVGGGIVSLLDYIQRAEEVQIHIVKDIVAHGCLCSETILPVIPSA